MTNEQQKEKSMAAVRGVTVYHMSDEELAESRKNAEQRRQRKIAEFQGRYKNLRDDSLSAVEKKAIADWEKSQAPRQPRTPSAARRSKVEKFVGAEPNHRCGIARGSCPACARERDFKTAVVVSSVKPKRKRSYETVLRILTGTHEGVEFTIVSKTQYVTDTNFLVRWARKPGSRTLKLEMKECE